MAEDTVVDAGAAETPTASRWEDYIDIFFSPAELYRRRAADRVGPPLITLLVLSVIVYAAMLPATGMIMRTSAAAANPEAAEAIARMGPIFQVIGGITVPITFLVITAGTALVLWLTSRFAEIRADYSRAMLIVTYAAFVYLLAQIAGYVAVLIHGEAGLDVIRHTSFGPLRFVGTGEMNPVLMALLRRLDVFALWQAVLWGIGLSAIYGVTRGRAAIAAAAAWILVAIPTIVLAALGFGPKAAGG
jgi:hypothetical protein